MASNVCVCVVVRGDWLPQSCYNYGRELIEFKTLVVWLEFPAGFYSHTLILICVSAPVNPTFCLCSLSLHPLCLIILQASRCFSSLYLLPNIHTHSLCVLYYFPLLALCFCMGCCVFQLNSETHTLSVSLTHTHRDTR